MSPKIAKCAYFCMSYRYILWDPDKKHHSTGRHCGSPSMYVHTAPIKVGSFNIPCIIIFIIPMALVWSYQQG